MIRAVILALPLSACMHTPCPVPMTCATPEDCVCLVTGTIDAPRGGDGGQGFTPAKTPDAPAPDAPAPDNGGDSGGGHSNGASSDANGASSDDNGGKSDD